MTASARDSLNGSSLSLLRGSTERIENKLVGNKGQTVVMMNALLPRGALCSCVTHIEMRQARFNNPVRNLVLLYE